MEESIFLFKGGWTTVTIPSPAHVWEAAETRIRIAEHLDFLPSGLPRGTSEAITAPSEKQAYLISTDCVLFTFCYERNFTPVTISIKNIM